MRDRSGGHEAAPWTHWVAYSSIAAIGVATVLSGLVISGVTVYRNATSSKSRIPEPGEPQVAESIGLDANDLVCFQPSHHASIAPDDSETETPSGIIQPQKLLALDSKELENKITSFGEKILIQEESAILQQVENRAKKVEDFREAKKQGAEQYAASQYQAAANKFKAARKIYKNSPENLIYLNNALASESGKFYALAVTVPLGAGQQGSDLDTTMAILKGAAHAQDDINQAGGIQGIPLKLLIINDFDNSPQSAEAVAQILSKKQNILGVVGHNANKATLAARRVYENSGLTSISPGSTSADLPPGHTFAFRTVPNDIVVAKKLAAYMLDKNRSKAAVFYEEDTADNSTSYSQVVKETFEAFLNTNIVNGEVVKEFNLADFNSDKSESLIRSLEQLIVSEEIDTITLVPSHSDESVLNALKVAILSRKLSDKILIIGNDAMYDSRIAKCGDKVTNMVAVSFWDMNFARTSLSSIPLEFARRASSPDHSDSLWESDIHWLSAMAYDTVLTFSQALKENHPSPTRANVAVSLSADRFSIDGATGIVKFDKSGDRVGNVRLVKVLPTNAANPEDMQYDFQPIFSDY